MTLFIYLFIIIIICVCVCVCVCVLYTSFYAYLRSIKNTDMGKSERHKHKRIISPGNIYIYIYIYIYMLWSRKRLLHIYLLFSSNCFNNIIMCPKNLNIYCRFGTGRTNLKEVEYSQFTNGKRSITRVLISQPAGRRFVGSQAFLSSSFFFLF